MLTAVALIAALIVTVSGLVGGLVKLAKIVGTLKARLAEADAHRWALDATVALVQARIDDAEANRRALAAIVGLAQVSIRKLGAEFDARLAVQAGDHAGQLAEVRSDLTGYVDGAVEATEYVTLQNVAEAFRVAAGRAGHPLIDGADFLEALADPEPAEDVDMLTLLVGEPDDDEPTRDDLPAASLTLADLPPSCCGRDADCPRPE